MKKLIKEIFIICVSFGLLGDYNVIRKLAKKYKVFYPLYKMYEHFHASFLPIDNIVKGDIYFPHGPIGCFFSKWVTIGEHCVILQHVTIGSNTITKGNGGGAPVIKDNVFIGAGAKIIGNITIGNNVKIGAGCIVVTDIPDNAVVVMNKPRIIIK